MPNAQSTPSDHLCSLLAGTPYRPQRLLGRGRMGEVWLVRHTLIERDFALKVLHRRHSANPEQRERLWQEARAMAALEHPNIVEITDLFIAPDGCPCLVMELLHGHRLDRELLRRKILPGPEAASLARQALSALITAHQARVVHRDIRPENLFLHQHSARTRVVKLIDFGLARVIGDGPATWALRPLELTRTGTVVGSPRFIPPEVLAGERMGPEGDVYSLGVVMYLCLVGIHSNFDWSTTPVFRPPSQCGAVECSERLDQTVLQAVESDRRHRFRSAREFLAALEAT
ncbi:MAG TPA: serine/threonine-protein kinase [Polyangiaceae bacterium]|nr:serine/threonine-protein kinase [Polyangiaceae bacterium]